ncbi:MAG: hypothetical protein HC890_14080 [Chloroflexaceae bacterium]|nr:hypothetical protein [Chloroflexaceae bacterium]
MSPDTMLTGSEFPVQSSLLKLELEPPVLSEASLTSSPSNPATGSRLIAANGWLGSSPENWQESHLTICSCSYCCNSALNSFDGLEFDPIATESVDPLSSEAIAAATVTAVTAPGLAVPQLSSNPTARAKIYLDFSGHTTVGTTWNSAYNGGQSFTTPAYDTDGNTSSFSSTELQRIQEIWQRVAEDFAPFNIDVTTIEPSASKFSQGKTVQRVVIGGSASQWYRAGAGGVALLNSWQRTNDTPVFVFENDLGNAKYIADAASHEVGHAWACAIKANTTLAAGESMNIIREPAIGGRCWASVTPAPSQPGTMVQPRALPPFKMT